VQFPHGASRLQLTCPDGSDDCGAAEGTSTDFVKLSSAKNSQMTTFAANFDLATIPGPIRLCLQLFYARTYGYTGFV
jgi:hypothetical protein